MSCTFKVYRKMKGCGPETTYVGKINRALRLIHTADDFATLHHPGLSLDMFLKGSNLLQLWGYYARKCMGTKHPHTCTTSCVSSYGFMWEWITINAKTSL